MYALPSWARIQVVRERGGSRSWNSTSRTSRTNDQSGSGPVTSSPLVKGPPATIAIGPSEKRAATTTPATATSSSPSRAPATRRTVLMEILLGRVGRSARRVAWRHSTASAPAAEHGGRSLQVELHVDPHLRGQLGDQALQLVALHRTL